MKKFIFAFTLLFTFVTNAQVPSQHQKKFDELMSCLFERADIYLSNRVLLQDLPPSHSLNPYFLKDAVGETIGKLVGMIGHWHVDLFLEEQHAQISEQMVLEQSEHDFVNNLVTKPRPVSNDLLRLNTKFEILKMHSNDAGIVLKQIPNCYSEGIAFDKSIL